MLNMWHMKLIFFDFNFPRQNFKSKYENRIFVDNAYEAVF